jgi:hypothetical protein
MLGSNPARNRFAPALSQVGKHDTEASLDSATELNCSACGSLAFRYPRVLDDDKPVICAVCGAFISTGVRHG